MRARQAALAAVTPEDGRLDWNKPARQLHNLVRAVTDPWPGAYSFAGVSKFIVWKSRVRDDIPAAKPGTVVSVSPLVVSCGEQALEILPVKPTTCTFRARSWRSRWVWLRALITSAPVVAIKRRTRVLILGVNGFIGNHLTERLLKDDNYEIYGLDIGSDAISRFLTTRASTSLKGISASIPNGSNTTLRNVTWCCRWWPSPRQSNTPVTRCACSSWTSKRT
jgi:hypothetical protein